MDDKRKQKMWVIGLSLVGAYLLSAGPLHWFDQKQCFTPKARRALLAFYIPVQMLAQHGPLPVRAAFKWYSDAWTP